MSDSPLVAANRHLLEQARELLGRVPDAVYATGTGAKPVGPHFRHVFEHYSCFLLGSVAGSREADRRVNYDARPRVERLETERSEALREIERLLDGLARLDRDELETPVDVRLECGVGGEGEQWSRSTLRRELQFLLSHTVHHFALIALLLAQQGFEVGDDFGVAPSTLKHWQGQAACAPQAG